MHPTIALNILSQQRTSYALLDRALTILEYEGTNDQFYTPHAPVVGRSVVALVPELLGSEELLSNILAGSLPALRLEHINRTGPDDTICYMTLTIAPFQGAHPAAIGLLIATDTTEQGTLLQLLTQQRNELRLLQTQLTRQNGDLAAANAELRQLDETKSMFVSVAAHELRNPLTPIIGYIDLLLDGACGTLTSDQRAVMLTVQANVLRLRTITTNMLDLAGLEAGRMELHMRPTDIQLMIEMITRQYRPLFAERKQHFTTQVRAGLPLALCDEVRVTQVLNNLLSNASKYTVNGGTITVRVAPAAEEGFVQVAVSDTGVGIAPEYHARLFTRFFRTNDATHPNVGGTGLGLHISRSLVELHGGRIWFESAPNQGSTFYFVLPTAEPFPISVNVGEQPIYAH